MEKAEIFLLVGNIKYLINAAIAEQGIEMRFPRERRLNKLLLELQEEMENLLRSVEKLFEGEVK